MFQNIDLFRLSSQLAQHSARRQGVIAQNIANADTPNYKARDIGIFDLGFRATSLPLSHSRMGHMSIDGDPMTSAHIRNTNYIEPNGNTVALETEMTHAVDAERSHKRALAVYRSALTVMHRVLG